MRKSANLRRPALLALLLTAGGPAAQAIDLGSARIIDLTHTLSEDIPVWPGAPVFSRDTLVDYDQGYLLQQFHLGDNNGTHVDSPGHFIKGGLLIDQLAVDTLVAPAVVIDVQAPAAANPDHQLTRQEVLDWEAAHGAIPPGAFVILNTGWHKKWAVPGAYNNLDANGAQHFPGFGADSAALLLERGVTGIGIDTLSLDHGASTDFATHLLILGAGKHQVENLANLDALPPTGAYISIGVIPIKDAGQAPARVFAYIPAG